MQPLGSSPDQQPLSYNPKPHLERRIRSFSTSIPTPKPSSCSNPINWIKHKVIPKKSGVNHFDKLPFELKMMILEFLPGQMQKTCRQVDSKMRAVIDDPRSGFWAKVEEVKIQGEVPQPILDLVGGLEAFLQLPVLNLSKKGLVAFTPEASRDFEKASGRRVRALKPDEAPVLPARFIDEAGRYGLILGFTVAHNGKMVLQVLHEQQPRFVHQGAVTWLMGDNDGVPPPPMREDIKFIGDRANSCQAALFMQEIREKGIAQVDYEVGDGALPFHYVPVKKS